MSRVFTYRKRKAGLSNLWAIMLTFLVFGCIEPIDTTSDICLNVPLAEAEGIKRVYFGPFQNQKSATAEDTVSVSEFGFNLELSINTDNNEQLDPFFSNTDRINCQGIYSIRNISNFSVILLEPFEGLAAGTDISFLLLTPSGQSIAQLREFDRVSVYIGTRLNFNPKNISRLKTRTFLFLRDGSQVFLDSTSPYLKPR